MTVPITPSLGAEDDDGPESNRGRRANVSPNGEVTGSGAGAGGGGGSEDYDDDPQGGGGSFKKEAVKSSARERADGRKHGSA